MNLLILTQKIDQNDSVLGFFHNWVQKLAPNFEKISVICLQKGAFDLPQNVEVLSLGKEGKRGRLVYIWRFFKFAFWSNVDYDAVFVHMNQEYILLGGIFWKILGKKVYFWRNHPKGSLLTRIAVFLSEKVFYTSKTSFTAKSKKSIQMPVGIDTEKFKSQISNLKTKNSILSLGRISPVKNIHLMLDMARIMHKKGDSFTLDVVGDPVNQEDFAYKDGFLKEYYDLIKVGIVKFLDGVPNYKTPEIYSRYEIFLNLTPPGSFDKTILEAAACGCAPFVHAELGNEFINLHLSELDPEKIALDLEKWFTYPEEERRTISQRLQKYVLENHSLSALIEKLAGAVKG